MKNMPLAALLVVFTACSGASKSGPKRVKNPESLMAKTMVFNGDDGVKVEVVELTDGKNALVKVSGTRSQFEGKVVEAEIVDNGGGTLAYQTKVRGRSWNIVVRESRRRGGSVSWRSWLGAGYRNGVDLIRDEAASKSYEQADLVALYRLYEDQKHDGTLDKLSKFDRKFEEDEEMEDLRKEAKRLKEACGIDAKVSVAWDTVDDETLKKLSISGYCDAPLGALRGVCKHKPGKDFAKGIKKIQCRYGDKSDLKVAKGKITWTVSKDSVNTDQFNRKVLLAQKIGDKTLKQHIALAKTRVCANDDRSRYIVIAPSDAEHPGVLYGDGKKFTRTRAPQNMGDGWFLEPRMKNPGYNKRFRGNNMQNYSKVDADVEKNTCELLCGGQSKDMQLLSAKDALAIADNLTIAPDPHPREPYALARDRRGTYYYVERNTEPGKEQSFQLYVGRKGNLKKQQMRDIVSDSEGEIFSSKKGELRLVLDKSAAFWIKGKRKSTLTLVPVVDNMPLIYNDLGVYTGQQLGTPCDDFDMD